MASGTINNPLSVEIGTLTAGSSPDCTASASIKRCGNIVIFNLVITAWGDMSTKKTRTLYIDNPFPPTNNVSVNIYLKASNGIQTAALDIKTNGVISIYNDGAFTSTIVRTQIVYPCSS